MNSAPVSLYLMAVVFLTLEPRPTSLLRTSRRLKLTCPAYRRHGGSWRLWRVFLWYCFFFLFVCPPPGWF